MALGLVIVTYNTGEEILDCLESVIASHGCDVRILVVDNESKDNTVELIRDWAEGRRTWQKSDDMPFEPIEHGALPYVETHEMPKHIPEGQITLWHSGKNGGYAYAVNKGCEAFKAMDDIDYFWILNPDSVVLNDSAAEFKKYADNAGRFGAIGGRVYYLRPPTTIQSDGGCVNLWTGVCSNLNAYVEGSEAPTPRGEDMDYVMGAHMLVSREFLDVAGPMPEHYFIYYDEVSWCLNRGDLPLKYCQTSSIHHIAGTVIGSHSFDKAPSKLASYFMARSRQRFIAEFKPIALPIAVAFNAGKIAQMLIRGQFAPAGAAIRGMLMLPPSRDIKKKIA